MTKAASKITGANAGGPCELAVRKSRAVRIAQFCRWAIELTMKRHILLFTACICIAFHSAIGATNLLSVYLVADKVFPQ